MRNIFHFYIWQKTFFYGMSENSTSSEESTTNRLSIDPSDMTTPVDMTTTSNRTPPDGEANATTSGLAQTVH
jgi:hypothetical protein